MSNCEYQNYIYVPYISQHVKSLWFACQSIKNKFCIYLFISMHDIQDNNISNLNYLKRKLCLREQKEGKKKKITSIPFSLYQSGVCLSPPDPTQVWKP